MPFWLPHPTAVFPPSPFFLCASSISISLSVSHPFSFHLPLPCHHALTESLIPPCPTPPHPAPRPPRWPLLPSSRLPSAPWQPHVGPLPTEHQLVPHVLITQTPRAGAWHWSSPAKRQSFPSALTKGKVR